MPVYNCEPFLAETIHSILEQTYINFEVVAINDGSTDRSGEILEKYSKFDSRIRVISRENRGLVATLNEAINLAKGELLARIDGDDVCTPKRLEWQVAAMQQNKKAALCYGYFEIFSADGEFLSKEIRPSHGADMKRLLYTRNAIAHSSVMLRKDLLPESWYRDDVGPTEDYELWSRLAATNDFVCSPHIVMHYRVNTLGIMHTIGHQQFVHMKRNINNYWQLMGPPAAMSPLQIRRNMKAYMHEHRKSGFGAEILRQVLDNESQLAMKCLRRGYYMLGLKLFFATALSSRTGFRACRRRISIILVIALKKVFSSPSSQHQIPISESSK